MIQSSESEVERKENKKVLNAKINHGHEQYLNGEKF